MPELPEVETVRSGLAATMEGARVSDIVTNRKDLRFPLPRRFRSRVQGAVIEQMRRRGKYLIADLSTGESLIMHLGMSGRFLIGAIEESAAPAKHDHVVFRLDDRAQTIVTYNDPRRFGFMDLAATAQIEECRHFKGMGPEPLSNAFSPAVLNAQLAHRKSPIKTALLDQRVVAGLGNIYVCEALFRSGVSPRRRAASVAGVRGDRLFTAIIDVLREAIAAGGSSLKDFSGADGELGYFQHGFRVYGREGEPCRQCSAPVRRIVQSGRSTFFCSSCQR